MLTHCSAPGKTGAAAREMAAADKGGKLPAKVKDGKPVNRGLINRQR